MPLLRMAQHQIRVHASSDITQLQAYCLYRKGSFAEVRGQLSWHQACMHASDMACHKWSHLCRPCRLAMLSQRRRP